MKSCLFTSLIIIGVILFTYGEWRQFHEIRDNEYVTVWKTFGNKCYIVPGKYYGMVKPSDNYARTTNLCLLGIYVNEKTPREFIMYGTQKVTVVNDDKSAVKIYNFDDDKKYFEKLIFEGSKKKKVKIGFAFLVFNIQENYAFKK